MRDVDHAHISVTQGAHNAENLLRFGLGKRRGRLVEDQETRSLLDRPANLHHLLAGRAELLHFPLRLKWEMVFLDEARGSLNHLASVHPSQGKPGFAPKENIL